MAAAEARGQGRRDPVARRSCAAASSRAWVPVHRPRVGRRVHRRRRPRGPGGSASLARPAGTGYQGLASVSDPRTAPRHRAASPVPAPRVGGSGLRDEDADQDQRARRASWIGSRRWPRTIAARTTIVQSGSTVLISAAWAAPIRRAPGVERLDREERGDETRGQRSRARPPAARPPGSPIDRWRGPRSRRRPP